MFAVHWPCYSPTISPPVTERRTSSFETEVKCYFFNTTGLQLIFFLEQSLAYKMQCLEEVQKQIHTHTNLIMSNKNSWLQNPNNMHCRITCTSTYITICAKQENKIKAMSVNIPFGSWLRSTEQNAPQLPSATLSSAHGRTHRSRAAILSWRRPG